MYKCNNCGCRFDEPYVKHTTYEAYYGVSSYFDSYNKLELKCCPECESDDFDSVYDEEEDEEV